MRRVGTATRPLARRGFRRLLGPKRLNRSACANARLSFSPPPGNRRGGNSSRGRRVGPNGSRGSPSRVVSRDGVGRWDGDYLTFWSVSD